MERKSIVFYKSWAEATLHLSDIERGQALTAIIDYAVYGKKPKHLTGVPLLIFTLAKPLIDANNKRYVNGCKGGAPKGNQNARKTTEKQPTVNFENNQKTTEKQPYNKCNMINDKCYNLSIVRDTHNALSNTQVSDAAFEADSEEVRRKLAETKRVKDIAEYYNATVKKASAKLRACLHVNEFRRGLILARIAEYGEETLRQVINKAVVSNFLNYEASNAPVDLEWIMRPKNFPKVLEGKYDNRVNGKVANVHFTGENNPSVYENDEENWK